MGLILGILGGIVAFAFFLSKYCSLSHATQAQYLQHVPLLNKALSVLTGGC